MSSTPRLVHIVFLGDNFATPEEATAYIQGPDYEEDRTVLTGG